MAPQTSYSWDISLLGYPPTFSFTACSVPHHKIVTAESVRALLNQVTMNSIPDQDHSKKFIKNDLKEEVKRLRLQHSIVRDAMGNKLLFAPLDLTKPGLRILDSACADGCWLRDFASSIPPALCATHEYIGTDINPSYFPTAPSTPSIYFQKQSFNDPWPADWREKFNLVHQRFALAGAGSNPMPPIIHKFAAMVAPGGYIELCEIEFGGKEVGDAMNLVFTVIGDIFKTMNRDNRFSLELKGLLEKEGFVDVKEEVVTINVGGSGEGLSEKEKEFRARAVESMRMTTEGLIQGAKYMPPITFSHAKLDQLPAEVESGLKKEGGLWRIHVVWGRKL